MSQWIVKAIVNGVETDVIVNSDSLPSVVNEPAPPSPSTFEPIIKAASDFLNTQQSWVQKFELQFQTTPPVEPEGPVPTSGYTYWVRRGFTANVPAPYKTTDLGEGCVLIWAPTGTAAPALSYN